MPVRTRTGGNRGEEREKARVIGRICERDGGRVVRGCGWGGSVTSFSPGVAGEVNKNAACKIISTGCQGKCHGGNIKKPQMTIC